MLVTIGKEERTQREKRGGKRKEKDLRTRSDVA